MTTRMPPATISPLEPADLTAAVVLHGRLLPHGFFVGLGVRFMCRYYRGYLDSPYAYGLGAREGGRLVGALVGTLDHDRHTVWTTRNLPGLALAGGAALMRRPRMVKRFLSTRLGRYCRAVVRRVRRLRRSGHDARATHGTHVSSESGPPQLAVLAHVFVDPDCQGSGLGARLVDGFVGEAKAAGAARAELVTLAGASGAGAFYAARGWRRRGGEHVVDGRAFHTYVRDL
jgi:GNAT superfamily N-acetyltransferase